MGLKWSQVPPEMRQKIEEAERKYYEQGGQITHERYQQETPWVDRKLAGRISQYERKEQTTFAAWLRQNGWLNGYVNHGMHKATTCMAGTPDFIVPTPCGTLWLEFKSPGGKLSLTQQNFQLVLEQQGQTLHVVYTALEAIELVRKNRQCPPP